ncbi:MAG: hypothetical protein CMO01_15650 [Thalassobius sp.]|nr:hypothetical protein [Thalassovita sp.]
MRYIKNIIKYTLICIGIVALLVVVNFFVVKKLDSDIIELESDYPANEENNSVYKLDAKFIDGERFYLEVPLKNEKSILGFADTGGGISMLLGYSVEKHDLQKQVKKGVLKGFLPVDYIQLSDLVENSSFPKPDFPRNFIIRHPFSRVTEPHLFIPPMDDEIKVIRENMPEMEMFLGQNFFMGKAWTIDYINEQIWVNTPLSKTEYVKPNVQKIGFKKNSHNESIYGHPSMYVEIDGEVIDVLFDTGATIILTEDGKKDLNTDKNTIGGSFIAASIFDKWRTAHPDWKYYPHADMSKDVIEVPQVKVGTFEVGPVLFAKRPDENWSEGMIHSMDKIVGGAIGGSVLQYLKVIIDYNSELIKFEKPALID